MASARKLFKFGLQTTRDRAGLTVADGAEVNLPQAHNFSSGAADENLIRDVELVAGYRLLYGSVTQIAHHGQQAVAVIPSRMAPRAGV